MSVFRRGRSMAVRWAIGFGVLLAFPFLASGVAQAAMAGGNPLTTTNRPDLRTVHVNSAADQAEFCFDKTISNTGPQGGTLDATRFMLGGYRFDVAVAGLSVGVDTANTNCAQVGFSRDLSQYSFGTVADNAVVWNAGGNGALGNIGDSTANLDSVSHSGTADHTTGPDLVSVLIDNTNNRIIYNFDKSVGSISAGTDQRFLFYDSNGKARYAQFVVGSGGASIAVQFANADSVSLAKLAVVIRGVAGSEGQPTGTTHDCTSTSDSAPFAACDQGGDFQTGAPTESVPVGDGLTARPGLLSAALVPGPSNQIDFNFSLPITQGEASDLVAVTSNGQEVQANSETILSTPSSSCGTCTVRATFSNANLQNFQEEVVKAVAYGCDQQSGPFGQCMGDGAVESVNPPAGAQTRNNTTGGVSVGDNAGAFATGYSSGPDARSVTFSSNGTVVVQMDQRVMNPNGIKTDNCSGGASGTAPSGNLNFGCWVLLANDGSVVDPQPLSAAVINNSPFQSQVQLTYPPGDMARATALAIAGPPVDCGGASCLPPNGNGGVPGIVDGSAAWTFDGSNGSSGMDEQGTVRQVISPTASGVRFFRPAKGQHWHWLSKAQRARALARLRALERRHHQH